MWRSYLGVSQGQDSALLSPKQVLDSFRVKKLCQLLSAASSQRSQDAHPHVWGMVRASSFQEATTQPAGAGQWPSSQG